MLPWLTQYQSLGTILKKGLVLTSAAVGAGPRACPNEGNHRGLPLRKMAYKRIKSLKSDNQLILMYAPTN